MSATIEIPVIIAGGGPAGVTMAMELAYHGVRSVVIERRRRDESPSPRCNTTNARSMEIFRRLGCADAVRATGLPPDFNTDVVYMTRFNGGVMTRYERSTTDDVRHGTMHGVASNWPTPEPQHFISQIYLEPALREHARAVYDIDLREAWEFSEVAQTSDAVSVVARSLQTGETVTFRGQYLIGADGGGSAIRRAIGARLHGIPEVGNACSIYFEAPRLRELYERTPGWMYRFATGGVLVAIDGHDRWLLHLNRPPGMHFAGVDIEPAMFDAIGERFDYRVLSDVRWTPRAMVANKYREGRVFLVGDAAHVWVPMGGFGMNAAVADSAALAWMLSGTLQGWLDPKILDAYEEERSPIGNIVASQAAKWSRDLVIFRTPALNVEALEADPAAAAAVGAQIRAVNIGEFECVGMQLGFSYTSSPIIAYDDLPAPPFSLETYIETSSPGARAPHVILERSGKPLFDSFGPGFTLLRLGPNPALGSSIVSEAGRRHVPLSVIDVPDAEAVRKYQGFDLVLVRPDGHIAFRSHGEPVDASAVIDRVTGVLIEQRRVTDLTVDKLPATFTFGEGTRWYNGRLVFSDMLGERIMRFDPATNDVTVFATVPGRPNGLAVLPTGELLVANMDDRRVYCVRDDGTLEVYADLRALATGYLGDMVADGNGRIYVDDTGARVLDGEAPRSGRVILVDRDRNARVVLDELLFPNGIAISPDGNMLVLAETGGNRISQSRINGATGALVDPRTFIDLGDAGCDGMAMDANGGVWLCVLQRHAVERYDRAGHLTTRIDVSEFGSPVACALDPQERTLYIVGHAPIPNGEHLFQTMSRRATSGWLARATVGNPQPAMATAGAS